MSACWREEQPFYFPYNNSVCAVCCPPLVCPKKAILQPVTTRMRTNGHSIHPKKWKAIKNGKRKTPIFLEKKRIGQASTKISNKKGAVAFFFLILLWHRLKNLANQGCSKLSIGRFQTTLLPLLGFSVLCSKFGQFEDWISFALELLRRQMLPLFFLFASFACLFCSYIFQTQLCFLQQKHRSRDYSCTTVQRSCFFLPLRFLLLGKSLRMRVLRFT